MTARVQRQIAGLFVAEERGSHELKGGDAIPARACERRRTALRATPYHAAFPRRYRSATQSKSSSTVPRADQRCGQNMMLPSSFFGWSPPLYSNPSWNLTSESWYSCFMYLLGAFGSSGLVIDPSAPTLKKISGAPGTALSLAYRPVILPLASVSYP